MKTKNPAHVAAFPPELPPRRRYTLGGDEASEHQVEQDLARLTADVEGELRPSLTALVLIGRFARGEGGIVRRQGEPHATPSYRCLAVVNALNPNLRKRIAAVGHTWTQQLGVPVHLHACEGRRIDDECPTLWWLDVARGNAEVLCGDRAVLHRLRALDITELTPDEPSWAMTRACAGLAAAWLTEHPDAAQVGHALHLLALACGDATLLLSGRFGATLRSRETQLAGLGVPTERVSAYHEAASYLGAPEAAPTPNLASLSARTALMGRFHLETEAQRCGTPTQVNRFMRSSRRLFEPRPVRAFRPSSWLRALGQRDLSYPYVGDPRERLARAAAGLAYDRTDPGCRLLAARLLHSNHRDTRALSQALERLRQEVTARPRDSINAGFYD